MKISRFLPLAIVIAAVGVPAFAASDDGHQAHHAAGTTSSPATKGMAGKAGPEMARMDAQMKTMGEMHDKMMAAKTPEERNSLMAEHMKAMQGGMDMMKGMSSSGAMGGMGSMNSGAKGDMASRHQMMEKHMAMMQSTIQMMMDRLPPAPMK